MIPEGWKEARLSDLATIRRGAGSQYLNYVEQPEDGIRLIRIGDFLGNDPVYVQHSRHIERFILTAGDILIAGTGATAGIVFEVPDEFEGLAFSYNAPLIQVADQASKRYIYYVLTSNLMKRQQEALFTGNAQPFLDTKAIGGFRVPLPKREERIRIAEVLETWDRAIETVEALIANARAQKQALMQQLLPQGTTPPKKRLPGFSGQWKQAALGEIGAISSAGVDKKIVEGETGVRLLNFLDAYKREFIHDADLEHVVTAPKAKIQGCSVNKGDVFFTPSSETRDDIALAAVAAEDMPGVVYSYHVVRFRPTKRLDLNFSAFLFQTDDFKRQAYRLGDGSGQRYVISQSNFRKMQVSLPDIEEQAAIGSLLAEHSKSIAEYETQLSALRQEKAALMQQLLTGKRRVKAPESEVA
ncbi:restriction endonuclease subunit S [Erythrobacter westpacificensis]|uniref:Restriction endonuclease subunit S n=1 Tax=Erythrobacter westpacificensis TaxID=1055231 RepID=A0ABP9JXT5_9SPHN